MSNDAGFFRNLSGLATEYVRQKRRSLAEGDPETNVDSTGGGHRYNFGGQEIGWDDLRDIKDIRDSGGQVAQLMTYKALLNFGEGAEIHVEDDEETTQSVAGVEMTLSEWLEQEAFPDLDLLVLDLGEDALWYPAAYGELRETRAGTFKEALPAEPWTILPKTDEKGEIATYIQRTKTPSGSYNEQPLDPNDVWSIILNKASARDKTGISEVLRNEDEIRAFKENEQAINQAIELHGFPQRHIKVGREDGAPVSDDDLRRVRTIFDPRTSDANTAYFTGQDVDVETLEAHNFDYTAIHEMDMRNLTTALGLPLEAGNVGSDGLGSGKPAELRFSMLKLAIQANQRSFSVQFVENVIRPVIRDYSPFDHNATVTLDIGDPLEDIGDMADVINSIGDYMTNAEIRRKLDMPEPEDDDIGEAYRSPADIEAAEEEDGGGGGLDSLFSDGRTLSVPDNAVSISDRSEAPEGATVIEGDRGGLYYIPGGADDAAGDGQSASDLADGNPRAEIDSPDEAIAYLEDFDEDDFEFDHWGNGPSYDKVGEGSVVEIWTGDMGFDEERAVVTDADGETFTIVTEDGTEKTMSPDIDSMAFDHTEEAPLSDVWDDPANRADETTEPDVDTADVEDDPTWFEQRDFEEEYGAGDGSNLSEGRAVEVGESISRVAETTEDNGVVYHRLEDDQILGVVDGVLTKASDASRINRGEEQYITWAEEAGMDDGWYAIGEDLEESDGSLMVDMVDEDGETHSVDAEAVEVEGLIERKHKPTDATVVESNLADAYQNYDDSYPDDPVLDDNLSLDNISGELNAEQQQQIERGLGKAQELGLTDNVSQISAMDFEGEAAGETLGRFEPETGEIKINTERMTQETLDSLDDGFAVGESVEDIVVHEAVHAAHAEHLENEGWTPERMRNELLRDGLPDDEREIMQEAVSEYGAANPLEVVAEVGTMTTKGQEVPEEALHLYEKYGGPDL